MRHGGDLQGRLLWIVLSTGRMPQPLGVTQVLGTVGGVPVGSGSLVRIPPDWAEPYDSFVKLILARIRYGLYFENNVMAPFVKLILARILLCLFSRTISRCLLYQQD